MRRTPVLLLAASLTLPAGLAVFAQKPRPSVAPVPPPARKPAPPTQNPKLPEGIKTAKDPGAKENWKPEGPNDPFIYLYGDSATYRDTPDGGIANLVGNSHLLYKETRFESDRIVYNRKTQLGQAPGKVKVDDAQNTIVGDRGEADYGRKVAKLTGNITINARPKPGAENSPEGSARREFKEPATITCSEVVYNWKTKIADTSKDAVIRCKIKERLWSITADAIQYRGKDEVAILTGNVHATNDKGETVKTPSLKVLLTEGKEGFDSGEVRDGKFFIDDKEEGDGDPKTPPPPVKKPEEKKDKP